MTAMRMLPEFEAALRTVPGIREASVRTTADALPVEVHVVANDLKPAKQLVRDVQAVAMAQFDLDIDHRIVSVVQIPETSEVDPGPSAAPAPEADPGLRPALVSIRVERVGPDFTASVSLGIAGQVLVGSADGPASQTQRPMIVASATLSGLRDLMGVNAHIEHAQVVPAGSHEVAVTTLVMEIPRLGEQLLCGSALVRGDVDDAVARSVLAALNRRLAG